MLPKILKTFGLMFLTSLLGVSCLEPKFQINIAETSVYFQYEYVNHAWGFNHHGFTITPSGEVYAFDKTTPWVFSNHNKLSFSDLQHNIKSSVKVDTLISQTDIAYYQHLALFAIGAKTSDPVQQGADMGATSCKLFVRNPSDSADTLREIFLSQRGDFEFHNLSPEAALISAWLTKLSIH